jgi:hypothetical protein
MNFDSWVHIDMQTEELNKKKFRDTFINTCKISDNMDQLIELEKELKLYDIQFIQTCYVDGFKISAMTDNLKVCQHIYQSRDVILGYQRTQFDIYYRYLFKSTIQSIDSDLYIECCRNNCTNVIRWMLSVTTFDKNVIKRAFDIIILSDIRSSDTRSSDIRSLVNTLISILNQDPMIITQTLHSLSKNNYYDLIRNIYQSHKNIICSKLLYECFIIGSEQGHDKTVQIIRSLDPINIDKYIFSDIDKTPFIKAINNYQYLFLDILNDMKQYQITVYLAETEIIKLQINEYQIDWFINQALANGKINNLSIVSDTNKEIHFDHQIIHNLFIENIKSSVLISDNINKTKFERTFKCKNRYTEELCAIKFIIITDHYLNFIFLNKKLKESSLIVERDVISDLIGKNMHPIQKLKYRDIMNPYLDLKIAQISDPLIQSMIHESDECQMCMGQNDMMISCGHLMCIRCCFDWYIVNKKPLICYVCQQQFVMNECFCLC